MKLIAILATLTATGAIMAASVTKCFKPVDGPGMERDEEEYVPKVQSVKYWYMDGVAYKAEYKDDGKTIILQPDPVRDNKNENIVLKLEDGPDPVFYYPVGKSASLIPGKRIMPAVINYMTYLECLNEEYELTSVFAPILEGVTLNDMIIFELASILEGEFKDEYGETAEISDGYLRLPGSNGGEKTFAAVDGFPVNVMISQGKCWRFSVTGEGILILKEVSANGFVPVENGKTIRLTRLNGYGGRWPITEMTLLQRSMLEYFDDSALAFMRNEILARHGYIFSEKEVQSYFDAQNWYCRSEDGNDRIHLTMIEMSNINIIKSVEKSR